MKKCLIMALATLFGCALTAQDQNVIDMINNKGSIKTSLWMLEYDRGMEETLRKIDNLTQSDLETLVEMASDEINKMDNILKTRDKIIGKEKKQSKQQKKLEKFFKSSETAIKCFAQAEEIKAKANTLKEAAKRNIGITYGSMPSGKLVGFEYSAGNGFAGWSNAVKLNRNKNGNGGTLTYEKEQFRRIVTENGEEVKNQPDVVNVDDSVFVKVYKLIEEGKLYDENKNYQPLMDVMDGTSWSCWMTFEGKYISTGGYMAGPNHSDALNSVLKYLRSVYNQIAPPKEEKN